MVDLFPTKCNLCGGKVVLEKYPNADRFRYVCKICGAYVLARKNNKQALGILANEQTRIKRVQVHRLFDRFWRSQHKRAKLYSKLATEMGLTEQECHFGYMNLDQLLKAEQILLSWWRTKYDK